jgi:hypothetical protein
MTKFRILATMILATAGALYGAEAWAADDVATKAASTKASPAKASPATAASTPKTCTGVWDFIETDCQLVRHHDLRRDRHGIHLPDSRRAV